MSKTTKKPESFEAAKADTAQLSVNARIKKAEISFFINITFI